MSLPVANSCTIRSSFSASLLCSKPCSCGLQYIFVYMYLHLVFNVLYSGKARFLCHGAPCTSEVYGSLLVCPSVSAVSAAPV